MYQDIVELRAFYETPLGRITARLIRNKITLLWPDITNMDIMGLGYATPYLDVFRSRARHVVGFMPAPLGVVRWPRINHHTDKQGQPRYKGNLTALVHESNLPVRDALFDRILMIHTLEHTDKSRLLLREVWRTLAPGGRVIVVVPNRLGLWARADRTPFGHGKPFSNAQIRQILTDNMLTPTRSMTALHLPPFRSRPLLSLMTTLEPVGYRWWRNMAGALIIEAEKQIYATGSGVRRRKRASRPVVAGNFFDADGGAPRSVGEFI